VITLVPDCVGVPLIVALLRLRPDGRIPEVIDQVYGWTPPIAVSVEEYETPACPFGKETVVNCKVPPLAATEIVKLFEAVWVGELESFT
jgi:hypothetical protein